MGEYVYSAAVFAVQLQIDPLSPRAIPTSLRSVLAQPCCHFSQGWLKIRELFYQTFFFENDLFQVLLIGYHLITFIFQPYSALLADPCCHFSQGWSRFSWSGIDFIFRHTQLQQYLSYWVWLCRAQSKLSTLWFVGSSLCAWLKIRKSFNQTSFFSKMIF